MAGGILLSILVGFAVLSLPCFGLIATVSNLSGRIYIYRSVVIVNVFLLLIVAVCGLQLNSWKPTTLLLAMRMTGDVSPIAIGLTLTLIAMVIKPGVKSTGNWTIQDMVYWTALVAAGVFLGHLLSYVI